MDFEIISQECPLDDPLPKLPKMVLLHVTRWPLELKIEKPLNYISSQASGPISKIISQKCSSHAPLPKLLKRFHSAKQNGRQS